MIWHRIWRRSIKNRLTFLFFSITAGAVLVIYFYVVPQLESNLVSQKVDALRRDSLSYIRPFQDVIGREVTATQLDALTRTISEETGTRVTLLGIPVNQGNANGQTADSRPYTISDSQDVRTKLNPSASLVVRAARSGNVKTASKSAAGNDLAQAARPVFYQGKPAWVVVFSEPLDDVRSNVDLIQRKILIAGAIALIVAMASGYWAASFISRRIKRLERAAGDVASGNFTTPIPVDSEDELGQLAQAFNEMQRKLARLDTARREFIANASHELRTPIFSLGGFAELLQDDDLDEGTRAEFLVTMREQVQRLQKLTTDLLDLSKLDADSLELRPEAVSLISLAQSVAEEFIPAAAMQDAAIEVAGEEVQNEVEAVCDPQRTAQIVRVLLDNALRHTPHGTHVRVTAGTSSGPRPEAQLEVADDGPGIDARELPYVFDRFHTGDSGSGSGLGLAIAREMARRMNGRLEATSRPGCTAFTLTLPLAGVTTREGTAPARGAESVGTVAGRPA
jgi:signal transduction histidine kinase